MHNRIKRGFWALAFVGLSASALAVLPVRAEVPSVASLDANARATGNRRDIAVRIGTKLFATLWPATVSQVSANQVGRHVVIGIRVWGVKFHRPIDRRGFVDEVVALVEDAFAAAPEAEEVDLWASVPIPVRKGEIVTGDLAKPTSRVVYSLTARRGESTATLTGRADDGSGVFWDRTWERTAFATPSHR